MTMHANFHGILVSVIIAVAATFMSEHYGASAMLFALLLGMAVNFLSQEGRCVAGVAFTASTVLRLGVALLGMRITFSQITQLGWMTVGLVSASVVLTIMAGMLAARLCGFKWAFGLLTGGAVAICGASAAMAISAVLPHHRLRERATIFTIIGVSTLSTIAMMVYPLLVKAFGLTALQSGIFLGGTIHDVAQVVGAGYGMSPETGDAATVVKLLRVAMLLPVIFVTSIVVRFRQGGREAGVALLPWFAVAFALLCALNSTGMIPATVQHGANALSRWCLVSAIAAIGIKTQLKELSMVGWRPILLMLGETVFLALLVLGGLLAQLK
ncbi:MAG: putative sulfate exporter family transporter [Pseudomonadota bacterium]